MMHKQPNETEEEFNRRVHDAHAKKVHERRNALAREASEFAVVKILDGMAGSTFLFDTDEDASRFYEAAKKIHNMNVGRSKCALFPVGHDVMDQYRF